MPTFQVSLMTVSSSISPKQKSRRARKPPWYIVLRVIYGLLILTALTTLAIRTGLPILLVLLPVCTSLVLTRSQLSNLLHGTLLYGVLTVCLALIYFGGIIGLQLLVHSPGIGLQLLVHGSSVPVIIIVTTSLFFAVLFEPLRTRIQALIELRFNLRNDEAIKAVETFTSTLREEIDLDQLRERLFAVVQKTMQPQSVSLWVRVEQKAVQNEISTLPIQVRSAEYGRQTPHEEHKQEMQEPDADRFHSMVSSGIIVADNDPIMAYALNITSILEVDRLQLDSPVLRYLKTNEAKIALPLVSQGELIGLLILGSRLNGEDYAHEDRTLLNTLAAQVAPALRVAQMVSEQQKQVRERERIEQELRTAQFIQLSLLPKEVPHLPGWQITPYYQPAREVGGDFYDFLPFADGRLGLVIGDVTDKGVPAALVMATTHTMLRTIAQEQVAPGAVLARVNDLLVAEIPPKMFVTCFYAILDSKNGQMRYANAGQELPYRRYSEGVSELWATGMPLGMMPGTRYEEQEITLSPGDSVLFYSDGLVEAHNTMQEMFDYPRLSALIEAYPGDPTLIEFLLSALARFTGEQREQEDDLTMITLSRCQNTSDICLQQS